jgi:raffinose/stachyose/melibiose transport system substrate-binding protein
MYMQGPWAVGQVLAISPKLKMGTFALPATDDASQTKCRVNLDLAIWLPRSQPASQRTAAIQFLNYLMQPSVMNAYNQANLAFSPLKNAPPQKSPLVSGSSSTSAPAGSTRVREHTCRSRSRSGTSSRK